MAATAGAESGQSITNCQSGRKEDVNKSHHLTLQPLLLLVNVPTRFQKQLTQSGFQSRMESHTRMVSWSRSIALIEFLMIGNAGVLGKEVYLTHNLEKKEVYLTHNFW